MKKIFLCLLLFVFGFYCQVKAESVWRWSNPQNISVYIPQGDDKTSLMKKAFDDWQRKSKNHIAFKSAKSIEDSDIDVIFIEKDLTDYCGTPEAMGCAQNFRQNGVMHSRIYIAKRRPKGLLLSNTQVYAVMRHEIGHSLGLAHSKGYNDIMFASTNLGIAIRQEIGTNDIRALYSLYGINLR
ncbi:matrixin family metalloprotease [bacterium]|nr:matrixin family metalloprotease [bacterium]